jgi:ABC-type branched-subunit amino acid transport system substrate-binding protein
MVKGWRPLVPGWMHLLFGILSCLAWTIQSSLGEIKIGAVTCLTGALSTFGVSSIQGARLAVEEINAAGGTLGQPIQLIVEDNGSKA